VNVWFLQLVKDVRLLEFFLLDPIFFRKEIKFTNNNNLNVILRLQLVYSYPKLVFVLETASVGPIVLGQVVSVVDLARVISPKSILGINSKLFFDSIFLLKLNSERLLPARNEAVPMAVWFSRDFGSITFSIRIFLVVVWFQKYYHWEMVVEFDNVLEVRWVSLHVFCKGLIMDRNSLLLTKEKIRHPFRLYTDRVLSFTERKSQDLLFIFFVRTVLLAGIGSNNSGSASLYRSSSSN